MSQGNNQISWDKATQEKYKQMLGKIPAFLRSTAEKQVSKKAESLVAEDNRLVIEEKDMVDAFFAATPFGFHGPMKTDLEDLCIDYTKYGHPK